jgi:hypothetical protein
VARQGACGAIPWWTAPSGRWAPPAPAVVAFGEKRYQELLQRSFPADRAEHLVGLEMNVRRYRLEADAINARATRERQKAVEYQDSSAHKHHQADYFDLGELGVELALVLASVAILSKRGSYWLGGILLGLVGLAVVGAGFFV